MNKQYLFNGFSHQKNICVKKNSKTALKLYLLEETLAIIKYNAALVQKTNVYLKTEKNDIPSERR